VKLNSQIAHANAATDLCLRGNLINQLITTLSVLFLTWPPKQQTATSRTTTVIHSFFISSFLNVTVKES